MKKRQGRSATRRTRRAELLVTDFEHLEQRALLSVAPADVDQRSAALLATLASLDLMPVDASSTALATTQTFYVDFQGALNITYDGPVTIAGVNVPTFAAPPPLAGQEANIESTLVATLTARFARNGHYLYQSAPRDR